MNTRSNLHHWIILVTLISGGSLTSVFAQPRPANDRIPVIVKFNQAPGPAEEAALTSAGANVNRRYRLIPAVAADLPSAALAGLRNHPSVAYVEEDTLQYAIAVPNDPEYGNLWGLNNIGQAGGTPGADISAETAWNETTNSGLGNNAAVVAIVDTGAQVAPGYSGSEVTHPDLAANLWVNEGETPGNGIDDDGNGFVDDIHGYNFYDVENWLYYSADEDLHGTHVAGTVGAAGNNNLGVTGINWEARLMILKFIGPGGSGYTSDAIAAIEYAAENGANVINASWGGGGYLQSLKDAIEASGCVFVAAAGNGGADQIGDDTDVSPHYPSSYDSPNLIAVAATDRNDQIAGFSNYGSDSVDLGAPGVSILSTYPGSTYQYLNGTSMATPHVSGVASLVFGQFPGATPEEIKNKILEAVDPIPALSGITVTGGRLNAYAAVTGDLPEGPPPPDPAEPDLASADFSSTSGVVLGDYEDTHYQDNVYESITERESGGRPNRRHDLLEHIWTFNLTGGNNRFHVDAHRNDGDDADSAFVFEWSSSSSGPWNFMFQITADADTNDYADFEFPVNSGMVYVRARDDDRSRAQNLFDTLLVDHMYVDGGDGPVEEPPGGGGDTTAPVISNVASKVLSKKKGTFEITWNTDEPATSDVMIDFQIFYDPDPELVTSHRRTFQGEKRALYTYFVESVDAAGNNSGAAGPYFHQN